MALAAMGAKWREGGGGTGSGFLARLLPVIAPLPAVAAALALHARHYCAGEYGGGVDGGRGLGAGCGVKEQRVLIRHTAEQIAQELVAVLHTSVTRHAHQSCSSTTCCVFSCSQDGAALRPKVNAGGAIFCSRSSRELAVRGG